MNIAINKAHYPVTVLGYGTRIGIWLQGCSIRCKGCISRDTWEPDERYAMEIDRLLEWCRSQGTKRLDGVTISGGEPFDQPEPLRVLLSGLKRWISETGLEIDILCYSGYPQTEIEQKHLDILDLLDVCIPEPYDERQPVAALRGSSNQSIMLLTDLAEKRYQAHREHPEKFAKQFQIMVDGGSIWFVGIPDRGDMDRLAALCAEKGLTLGERSWERSLL